MSEQTIYTRTLNRAVSRINKTLRSMGGDVPKQHGHYGGGQWSAEKMIGNVKRTMTIKLNPDNKDALLKATFEVKDRRNYDTDLRYSKRVDLLWSSRVEIVSRGSSTYTGSVDTFLDEVEYYIIGAGNYFADPRTKL
tara:strand:+ start:75 stop:485 length:411 start_codon:yes stop_codon:yes gene_type:complete